MLQLWTVTLNQTARGPSPEKQTRFLGVGREFCLGKGKGVWGKGKRICMWISYSLYGSVVGVGG